MVVDRQSINHEGERADWKREQNNIRRSQAVAFFVFSPVTILYSFFIWPIYATCTSNLKAL